MKEKKLFQLNATWQCGFFMYTFKIKDLLCIKMLDLRLTCERKYFLSYTILLCALFMAIC